jgi:hypothetical protein
VRSGLSAMKRTRDAPLRRLKAFVSRTQSQRMYRIVPRNVVTGTIFCAIDHHNFLCTPWHGICHCYCRRPASDALPAQNRSVTYVIRTRRGAPQLNSTASEVHGPTDCFASRIAYSPAAAALGGPPVSYAADVGAIPARCQRRLSPNRCVVLSRHP